MFSYDRIKKIVLQSSAIQFLSQYLEEKERKLIQLYPIRIFLVNSYVFKNQCTIVLISSQFKRLYSSSVFLTHVKLSPKLMAPMQLINLTNFLSCMTIIDFYISSIPIYSSQTQSSSRHILHQNYCGTSMLMTSSFSFLRGRPFLPVAFGFINVDLIYEYVLMFGCLFLMWVQSAAYEPYALPQPCVHTKSFTIYQFLRR